LPLLLLLYYFIKRYDQMKTGTYSTKNFSDFRKASADLLNAAKRKNMVHALIEVDVTRARSSIREVRKGNEGYFSLIGFIIHCASKTIGKNKTLHGYRDWRNRILLFDDVDVSTTIERRIDGNSEVIPEIIRSANKKSVSDISEEIKNAKTKKVETTDVFNSIRLYLAIPAFLRRLIFRILDRCPQLMKRKAGTIMVTSVNMIGRGAGWGIPIASHTLNIAIGGIVERLVKIKGKIENREHLCLTISFDHNIIDGAPAARFIRSFKKLLEKGLQQEDQEGVYEENKI